MANLKQDLINNLGNEKYYNEIEIVRLLQEPNMNYKEKIEALTLLLKEVATLEMGMQLIGKYLPEIPQTTMTQNQPNQPAQPAPGQTHAE